jgi:hypothetical protein
MAAALTPRVRTAIVCERIKPSQIEDDVFDLKGVRYAMTAGGFPFAPARLWLLLVLSSPRKGRFPGNVKIVHDRTDKVLFMAKMEPAPEFLEEHDLVSVRMRLRPAFPEAGRYTVRVSFFQATSSDVLKAEFPFYILSEEA